MEGRGLGAEAGAAPFGVHGLRNGCMRDCRGSVYSESRALCHYK